MKTCLILFFFLIVTAIKVLRPGGVRSVIAETLAIKHQLVVDNRTRKRAPNLTPSDRFLFGLWAFLIKPSRIDKIAVIVSTATIFKFHKALKNRKYNRLFSSKKSARKPGPKGPSQELINAIVEMKQRNPRFGCPRIAQQILKVFGIEIEKDVVRRILAKHYRPAPGGHGPSWLTLIGHMKDSLWSVDLFRCESILLKTHWVMVVMDQHTRWIVGFGVQVGHVDGISICRMFNHAVTGMGTPKYLSTDNDPLFLFHQWQANMRILSVTEIKTVPYVTLSHPFVERLIGTIRREYLDHVLFWNTVDLERKLNEFKVYFNESRVHSSLEGNTPVEFSGCESSPIASLNNYRWKTYCRGLFQLPVAA